MDNARAKATRAPGDEKREGDGKRRSSHSNESSKTAALSRTLEELNMGQYLWDFVEAGFEDWEVLCQIRESDLYELILNCSRRGGRHVEPAILTPEHLQGRPQRQTRPSTSTSGRSPLSISSSPSDQVTRTSAERGTDTRLRPNRDCSTASWANRDTSSTIPSHPRTRNAASRSSTGPTRWRIRARGPARGSTSVTRR